MNSCRNIALLGECMLELRGDAFGTMQQGYSGDTFNTAVYLARCADKSLKVWYATALGDDALSFEMLRRWAGDGLERGLVTRIPNRLPGIYQIEVDAQGERRFNFWRENSAARAYFDIDVTPLEAQESLWDAFYFSGISLAILPPAGRERVFALAERLRSRDAQVIFDNNYRPRLWDSVATAREVFERAFKVASMTLVTLDDHQALFGYGKRALALEPALNLDCPEVVIKRGNAPTLLRIGSAEPLAIPIIPVSRVVDTTAAGDSFAAGYMSRRLAGATAEDAAAFGNLLASRVIQHPGAIIPVEAMADLMAA